MIAPGSLLCATMGLHDIELRASYVAYIIGTTSCEELAPVLDVLCARAEAMEKDAREFLVVLVDAVSREAVSEPVQRLREEAVGAALLSLERALRLPLETRSPLARASKPPEAVKPPDYGMGRPVTLGERKSFARRPTRDMIERLINDPHPDVIRRLLVSPKLVEDDVIRLAARRPNRGDVLAEIIRSPRWIHRTRVRMAVLLNPDTPLPLAATLSSVLMRQELELVVESPHVPAPIRALCLERLQRRPPVRGGSTLQ